MCPGEMLPTRVSVAVSDASEWLCLQLSSEGSASGSHPETARTAASALPSHLPFLLCPGLTPQRDTWATPDLRPYFHKEVSPLVSWMTKATWLVSYIIKSCITFALAGVAQWIECLSEN